MGEGGVCVMIHGLRMLSLAPGLGLPTIPPGMTTSSKHILSSISLSVVYEFHSHLDLFFSLY